MANITTYLADKLLAHSVGQASFTEPTAYCALFTTIPTMPAGTGGTEVSGGSYARVSTATSIWTAASAEAITNGTGAITFTTATGSWGTITSIGLYDALTVGNLLWAGTLTASKTVGSGDTFSIPVSDLTISLS